jgi:hypothetical protein
LEQKYDWRVSFFVLFVKTTTVVWDSIDRVLIIFSFVIIKRGFHCRRGRTRITTPGRGCALRRDTFLLVCLLNGLARKLIRNEPPQACQRLWHVGLDGIFGDRCIVVVGRVRRRLEHVLIDGFFFVVVNQRSSRDSSVWVRRELLDRNIAVAGWFCHDGL